MILPDDPVDFLDVGVGGEILDDRIYLFIISKGEADEESFQADFFFVKDH